MSIPEQWNLHTGEVIPNLAYQADKATVRDGDWSDPSVWGGSLPSPNDKLHINHNVVLDSDVEFVDAYVSESGDLMMPEDVAFTVRLRSLIFGGSMSGGSKNHDIIQRFVFRDDIEPPSVAEDPNQFFPGVVCVTTGKMTFKGAEKTPYMELAFGMPQGASTALFKEPVMNWKPGDQLFIGDTRQPSKEEFRTRFELFEPRHEWLTVASVDGSMVTFESPSQYEHPAAFDEDGVQRKAPTLMNFTRNIVFESESLEERKWGHVLANMRAYVDIGWFETHRTGRTSGKREATGVTGDNPIGRYGGFHGHHLLGPVGGVDGGQWQMKCVGLAAHHCKKSGLTIHGTHYGLWQDIVVSEVEGIGVWVEDGNEVGNRFERIRVGWIDGFSTKRYDQDWDHVGTGFAMRNGWNHCVDIGVEGGSLEKNAHAFNWYQSEKFGDDTIEMMYPALPGQMPNTSALSNATGNVNAGYEIKDLYSLGPWQQAFAIWNFNGGKWRLHPRSRGVQDDSVYTPYQLDNVHIYNAYKGLILYSGTHYTFDGLKIIGGALGQNYSVGVWAGPDAILGKVNLKNVEIEGQRTAIATDAYRFLNGLLLVDGLHVGNCDVGVGHGNTRTVQGGHRNICHTEIRNFTFSDSLKFIVTARQENWGSTVNSNFVKGGLTTAYDLAVFFKNVNGDGKSYRWYHPESAPDRICPVWTREGGVFEPEWRQGSGQLSGHYIHGIDPDVALEIKPDMDISDPQTWPTNQMVHDWLESGGTWTPKNISPHGDIWPLVAPCWGKMQPSDNLADLGNSQGVFELLGQSPQPSSSSSSSSSRPSSSSQPSSASSSSSQPSSSQPSSSQPSSSQPSSSQSSSSQPSSSQSSSSQPSSSQPSSSQPSSSTGRPPLQDQIDDQQELIEAQQDQIDGLQSQIDEINGKLDAIRDILS